jgi:PAS domain-containing protein
MSSARHSDNPNCPSTDDRANINTLFRDTPMTLRNGQNNEHRRRASSHTELLLKDVALSATAEGITISDTSQEDNPLIYANAGFTRLTGYPLDEVIGKNCRFLQGAETTPGHRGRRAVHCPVDQLP